MNRNLLKKYAPQARRDFIQAVTDRASYFGLTEEGAEAVTVAGDTALIGGRAFPQKVADQRRRLEARIARRGFDQVMEAVAYTWFNRLVAIRFMELHGYLEHGYRVLSHPAGGALPEILEHADSVDLPGLDPRLVIELKLAGNQDAELYRMLLIAQCNALHKAMPFLFERVDDEMELLLPDNLLHSDSLIRGLVGDIPEEDWQEVEIIGWMYQFYISERKGEVIGKVVASEDIPAATQLFTPNWIVKYLVQNSLGRQWVATYPNSPLREQMEYYIEPAEQTPEVEEQLRAITPTSLDPEELTLLDPACGSGHILVEAYDLFKAIYQERGYPKRDIPRLILTKNLFGLEIDDRAAQLAAFALMMKARADDRRIFAQGIEPHVLSIQESKGLDAKEITEALNAPLGGSGAKCDISQANVAHLIELFQNGKTFGSLVRVPETLARKLPAIAQRVQDVVEHGTLLEQPAARTIKPVVEQAAMLSVGYAAVAANPPYIGSKGMNPALKRFAKDNFSRTKYNTFCMFIERLLELLGNGGRLGMITLQGWLFQDRYTRFRKSLLDHYTLSTMAHLGPRAFPEISGEVVQATAFIFEGTRLPNFRPTFFALYSGDSEEKDQRLRAKDSPITDIEYSEFASLPACAFLYWASPRSRELFRADASLGTLLDTREGMATADNDRFLRCFWEVDYGEIERSATCNATATESGKRWFPYIKGGEFRKWYGNNELLVNWHNDGEEIKALVDPKTGRVRSHNYNGDYAFRPGLTWSSISSNAIAARIVPPGFMFDAKGPMAFFSGQSQGLSALGIINSAVGFHFMRLIAPSLDFKLGHVEGIPFEFECQSNADFLSRISRCVEIARRSWDCEEVSPDFSGLPLLECKASLLAEGWNAWYQEQLQNVANLKMLEEQNNLFLLEQYGLQEELSPEVPEDQITLYRPNREEDIQRLISYAIGCMMGRYSLDKPGLIYAHSGGEDFDPGEYQTFPADSDGIIPITEFEWFEDDAANRLEEFIATAWPSEHLEENLAFIAESLGSRRGEPPRDTIRRYLAAAGSAGFYKHHLSMYKRRPIYWLFSSGKQRAFQGLVYLHRYNAGTLSRMRTEYVIPLQGKIDSRIDQLELDIEAASSTSHQRKLTKERDTLVKHREELRTFDEKLRHYADMRIELDLDDGVKVNYGKFGDLLAEVRTVTGAKAET